MQEDRGTVRSFTAASCANGLPRFARAGHAAFRTREGTRQAVGFVPDSCHACHAGPTVASWARPASWQTPSRCRSGCTRSKSCTSTTTAARCPAQPWRRCVHELRRAVAQPPTRPSTEPRSCSATRSTTSAFSRIMRSTSVRVWMRKVGDLPAPRMQASHAADARSRQGLRLHVRRYRQLRTHWLQLPGQWPGAHHARAGQPTEGSVAAVTPSAKRGDTAV